MGIHAANHMKGSKPWTIFYEDEASLIADMLQTKSDPKKHTLWKLVKGYEYIESFKRYYDKNGCLTEKQMVQLKRMAGSVFLNVHGDVYYEKVGAWTQSKENCAN